jgi:hypothetical protein
MQLGFWVRLSGLFGWVVVSLGCGQVDSGGVRDAGSDADASSVDCSLVGCAPPPLCSTGCTEPCGCCPCAEGEIATRGGTSYRCTGGCFAEVDADASSSAWLRFQVNEAAGPCPTLDGCKWQWIVTPEGAVATEKEGVTGQASMSAGDLSALDSILKSSAFMTGMQVGFTCDLPPTDIFYSIRLELTQVTYEQTVTGCVLSGPAGNPAQKAVKLVIKY